MQHNAKKDGPEKQPSGTQDSANLLTPKGEREDLPRDGKDDVNDFAKAEATKTAKSNDLKNDTTWFSAATNAD